MCGGEGRPANYTGCIVANTMRTSNDKRTRKPVLPKQPQSVNQQAPITNARTKQKSYSQTVESKYEIVNKRSKLSPKLKSKPFYPIYSPTSSEDINEVNECTSRLEYNAKGIIPKKWNANGLLHHQQELPTLLDRLISKMHFSN